MASTVAEYRLGMVKKIVFYSSITGTTGISTTYPYDGKIVRVVCMTSGNGGTVTLKGDDNLDLLLGAGAYTSGAGQTLTYIATTGAYVANEILDFEVSTTGAVNCYVYVR